MFFSLGNYLTHNDYWTNKRHVGWMWEKGKSTEIICYERQKRQNCAYRWWDLCQKNLVNDTNPCTRAPKLHYHPLYPQKGIPWHNFSQLVHQSFLSCCCRCFSNILMSQKYHNIKNKCNPFTKQWAINNNQVVFLYCICTVYTQRVKFVVYMYTKQVAVYFRLSLS